MFTALLSTLVVVVFLGRHQLGLKSHVAEVGGSSNLGIGNREPQMKHKSMYIHD
jgi:hypothetical protein